MGFLVSFELFNVSRDLHRQDITYHKHWMEEVKEQYAYWKKNCKVTIHSSMQAMSLAKGEATFFYNEGNVLFRHALNTFYLSCIWLQIFYKNL